MIRVSRMIRPLLALLLLLPLATGLSACGVKGALEAPPSLQDSRGEP